MNDSQYPPQRFKGPPHECWNCGGPLKKARKSKGAAGGLIVALLGVFLTFAIWIIGIPVILIGLMLACQAEGIWRCKQCHSEFPRKMDIFEI